MVPSGTPPFGRIRRFRRSPTLPFLVGLALVGLRRKRPKRPKPERASGGSPTLRVVRDQQNSRSGAAQGPLATERLCIEADTRRMAVSRANYSAEALYARLAGRRHYRFSPSRA